MPEGAGAVGRKRFRPSSHHRDGGPADAPQRAPGTRTSGLPPDLTPTQLYAEQRLGRPLTTGELALDIDGIDADLNAAKDALQDEIAKAVRKAIRQRLRGEWVDLTPTGGMLLVLDKLRRQGRRHALDEIRRLGIEPRISYAEELPGSMRQIVTYLQQLLGAIRVRVLTGTKGEISLRARSPISKELIERVEKKIPGVRDAASRLVPSSFTAGLADIYEAHADLFPCWQYSAVMDNATCPRCREHDGRQFRTLAELYTVLPNFGPNPFCLGDGRCRCRGVPCDQSERETRTFRPSDLVAEGWPAPPEGYQKDVRDLDSVLTIRSDQWQQPAPVRVRTDLMLRGTTRQGVYEAPGLPDEAPSIGITPTAPPVKRRFFLWHELGHYLDEQWLAAHQRGYASHNAGRLGRSIPHGQQEMVDLMRAIDNSEVVRTLHELLDNPRASQAGIEYLLRDNEMFARAFAQYVATKRGDKQVLDQVAAAAGHDLARGLSFMQWTPEEFEPIAAAFDRLLAALDWVPLSR